MKYTLWYQGSGAELLVVSRSCVKNSNIFSIIAAQPSFALFRTSIYSLRQEVLVRLVAFSGTFGPPLSAHMNGSRLTNSDSFDPTMANSVKSSQTTKSFIVPHLSLSEDCSAAPPPGEIYRTVQQVGHTRLVIEVAERGGRDLEDISKLFGIHVKEIGLRVNRFRLQTLKIAELKASNEIQLPHQPEPAQLKPMHSEAVINYTMAKNIHGIPIEKAYTQAKEEMKQKLMGEESSKDQSRNLDEDGGLNDVQMTNA